MRSRVIGAAGLGLLALGGLWLAFASASSDWGVDTAVALEPSWLRGPLAGVLPGLSDASFTALLGVMAIGYVAAVAFVDALPPRVVIGVVAALVVAFGLAPVLLSSDLFGYLAYARLEVLHGLSPYAHAAAASPGDPVYDYVFWQHATSPYGPLYTLVSLPFARLSLPAAVWGLKTLSTLAALLSLWLLARAAPRYGRSSAGAVLLAGGNPMLLLYAVGGGHNDLVVMAAVCAALLALGRAPSARGAPPRPAFAGGGGGLLAIALGLKATGGLLLPFALATRGLERRAVLAATGVTALGLAVVTVAVFGPHVLDQLPRIATGGSFVISTSGPGVIGSLLGTGVTAAVRAACAIAGLAGVAACVRWAVRGGDWLTAATLAGIAVLCAIPSLVPWYVAWVLPAAALARGRGARAAVVAFTLALVFTRLPLLGFATD